MCELIGDSTLTEQQSIWLAARHTAHSVTSRARREARPVLEVLDDYIAAAERPRPEVFGFVVRLVEGAEAHRRRITSFVSAFEDERAASLPAEVREMATICGYELLYARECDDVALFATTMEPAGTASSQDHGLLRDVLVYLASNAQR